MGNERQHPPTRNNKRARQRIALVKSVVLSEPTIEPERQLGCKRKWRGQGNDLSASQMRLLLDASEGQSSAN